MIWDVLLAYQGHTRVRRKARVILRADDASAAMLAAVAFFRGEHPELNRHVVKPTAARNASGVVDPVDFHRGLPKIVEVKEVMWAYDPEAPHKGVNRHKKGKWVTFAERERNRANRKRALVRTRGKGEKS